MKCVAVPRASCVTRCRNSNTLVGRHTAAGELAYYPTVCELIVKNDRVAVARRLANSAEIIPDRRNADGPEHRRTGRFVKDLDAFVDHLNELRRPDLAVGVGRGTVAPDARKHNAIKALQRPGNL